MSRAINAYAKLYSYLSSCNCSPSVKLLSRVASEYYIKQLYPTRIVFDHVAYVLYGPQALQLPATEAYRELNALEYVIRRHVIDKVDKRATVRLTKYLPLVKLSMLGVYMSALILLCPNGLLIANQGRRRDFKYFFDKSNCVDRPLFEIALDLYARGRHKFIISDLVKWGYAELF